MGDNKAVCPRKATAIDSPPQSFFDDLARFMAAVQQPPPPADELDMKSLPKESELPRFDCALHPDIVIVQTLRSEGHFFHICHRGKSLTRIFDGVFRSRQAAEEAAYAKARSVLFFHVSILTRPNTMVAVRWKQLSLYIPERRQRYKMLKAVKLQPTESMLFAIECFPRKTKNRARPSVLITDSQTAAVLMSNGVLFASEKARAKAERISHKSLVYAPFSPVKSGLIALNTVRHSFGNVLHVLHKLFPDVKYLITSRRVKQTLDTHDGKTYHVTLLMPDAEANDTQE